MRHTRFILVFVFLARVLAAAQDSVAAQASKLTPPAVANHVLDLDGDGSYVELPPNIFANLTQATVEVWAKWDAFQNHSRVFEFGAAMHSMCLMNHGTNA